MKNLFGLAFAVLVIFSHASIIRADVSIYPENDQLSDSSTPDEIRAYLSGELGSTSPMMSVIECESHFRQFDASGAVLTSSTTDRGVFQINEYWWLQKSKDLGYDIYHVDGNIKMGLYIYRTAGISKWTCAKNLGII